jgi:hypothetical protein
LLLLCEEGGDVTSEGKVQSASTSGGNFFVGKSQSQRHRDKSFSKVDFLELLEHDCGEKGTKRVGCC